MNANETLTGGKMLLTDAQILDRKATTARCCFSYPGTFGHECGKPAVVIFVKPSTNTVSGLFYSGRCAECAEARAGQDNQGIIRREKPAGQYNEWK